VGLAANTENHKEIMKKALLSLVPEPELDPEPVIETETPEEPEGGIIPGFPVEAIIIGSCIGFIVLSGFRKQI
jgi:hypothetical protein